MEPPRGPGPGPRGERPDRAGPLAAGDAYAGRNYWDDLYDRFQHADARAMDAALQRAFAAKGKEGQSFTLSEAVDRRLRDSCVIGGHWPPPGKADRAGALVERSGRRWYWGAIETEATVALELADGSARALRLRRPIELRFERRGQRSVCAAPDRLTFLPLAGDNRGVVLVVRGE